MRTQEPNRNHKHPLSYTAATRLAAMAPDSLLYYASRIGGCLHYWLAASKRRSYLANMRGAVRFDRGCRPWHAFQNQVLNVFEVLKAVSQDDDAIMERLTVEGSRHIDDALTRGRGLILATFHSGNWELSGLMLALSGYPLTTIAGEQFLPGWSEAIKNLKRRFGIQVLSLDGSLRNLYRELRANRVIVLHIDGDVFAGGLEMNFLGKRVHVPRGPAHLSRVLGAPVALAYCRRAEKTRLRVIVEPPLSLPATADDEERVTQILVNRVEKCILEEPGQWCIFRKL
jgi:KDO2-lipid IV(A) lauroyltransferase